MRLFAGGSLSASFQIRDEWGVQLQRELDVLAFDLHERMADPAVDPSIAATGPGLFTDGADRAVSASLTGLAARIGVNELVRPDRGGDLWRLRTGLGAAAAGPVAESRLLSAFSDAIADSRSPVGGSEFQGRGTLTTWFAEIAARVATRRVAAESDSAMRNSRAEALSARLMEDGVDSDAEMQRLLQYEQAYAANARVIQAIQDMLDQIMRL